jgi:transposase
MAYAADSLSLPVDDQIVNLGPLGLFYPLLDKLNIAKIIDRHIPTDPQAELSHGTVLAVLLAARLTSPTALVNVANWAAEHGTEFLWNVPADKFNDDRLGRSLDAFFEQRHGIIAAVTTEVLKLTNLSLQNCHFDTTHLVAYGSYEASVARPTSAREKLVDDLRKSPAHLSHGYLTKYKMLQLGMTSVVDDGGPIPVAFHLLDGNRSGHRAVAETYQLMKHYLRLPENLVLASDRGTCSAEHLATLLRNGHHALCAAPWQDYQALYDQNAATLHWQKASYLSREQQRRRDGHSSLPLEEYRLAVVNHQLFDPTTNEPFACRVLFVHSSVSAKESKERRAQNISKIKAGLEAIAAKLQRAHPHTTPASVQRQVDRLLAGKGVATHFHWQLLPLTDAEKAALPKPLKGFRLQTHRLVYSFDEASAKADEHHDGVSALVTTAPQTSSGDALLTEYKRQIYVEREHHELKTPLAVTPIFLKTPRRVEALVALMFLALQAQMTLERLYRQTVSAGAGPNEQRMTAERLTRMFGTCAILVEHQAYGALVRAAQLTAEQRRVIYRLSLETPATIISRNLSPPPMP